MSRLRALLASLTVTIMITDLVLVALACVPDGRLDVVNGMPAMAAPVGGEGTIGTPVGEAISLAGGIRGGAVQPAFLRALTRWLRNCWRGIGGNEDCRKKCFNIQSRPCGSDNDA